MVSIMILENRLFAKPYLDKHKLKIWVADLMCFFFCFGLIEGKERRHKHVDKGFTVALKWTVFKEFVS